MNRSLCLSINTVVWSCLYCDLLSNMLVSFQTCCLQPRGRKNIGLLPARMSRHLNHISAITTINRRRKVFLFLWRIRILSNYKLDWVLSSHRQYINERACLCANKILFMNTEIWISYSLYMSWNIHPVNFFNCFKIWKPFFSGAA